MNSPTLAAARGTTVTNVLPFHGLTLLVVSHQGTEYVYAKPLSDLAGLDWRGTKRVLNQEDNLVLYGTRTLQHPQMVAEVGSRSLIGEGLYLRLDRARMFLARISTKNMKAKGKTEAAEQLLKLQVEWAEVLHQYETQGQATRDTVRSALQKDQHLLIQTMKARDGATDPAEKESLKTMVRDMLVRLGYPPEQAGTAS